MRKRHLGCALSVLLLAAPLRAEPAAPASGGEAGRSEPAPTLRLGWLGDGAALGLSTAALGIATLIPVDANSHWSTQLLPIDDHLEGRYAARASQVSDVLVGIDVAAPVALFAGRGFDRETGKRVVVYGETLLVSLALDSLVKPLVSRPRPYVYSDDPAVVAYAASAGEDAHLSFYSRHSATTFCASVAGAYLFAQSTTDTHARAVVWGTELALAGATADLRTRAGKHFYSDVLVGATVGAGLGVLIPYLHGGPKVRPSKLEWLAIVLGPLVGVAVGELLPVGG
jgi:membrane-associated phospholipid phosphatase